MVIPVVLVPVLSAPFNPVGTAIPINDREQLGLAVYATFHVIVATTPVVAPVPVARKNPPAASVEWQEIADPEQVIEIVAPEPAAAPTAAVGVELLPMTCPAEIVVTEGVLVPLTADPLEG